MSQEARASRFIEGVGLVSILVVAGVALSLRYEDPLSTRAIGAEDPYTHIVFAREYLERGYFARSFHLATEMYPPGLHILAGVFWTLAGVDPAEFTRLFPPFLGAFAVVAVYALARRHVGGIGAAVGALALALAPEHVFRTNLLFPTALDLALLPAFFLLAILGAEGDRRALLALMVLGTAMAVAHPWILPLAALPVLAFALARALTKPGRLSANGRAIGPLSLALGALLVFAALFRWDQSGSGFGNFLAATDGRALGAVVPWWAFGLFVAAIAAFVLSSGFLRHEDRRPSVARAVRLAFALLVALALATLVPLWGASPQALVDYPRQLGSPLITLGLAGAVVAAGALSPLALLSFAFAAGAYLVTAVNFFQSEFIPHRTVVYLALALALLAAVAAGRLERALGAAVTPRRGGAIRRGTPPALAALLVAGALAVPIGASTPPPYEWYRYYDGDAYRAFETASGIMESDSRAAFVSAQWQPNLLLKALAPDMKRVHYAERFFASSGERQAFIAEHPGRAWHVLVDEYTLERAHERGLDTSFLEGGDYERLPCECGNVTLYRLRGAT